MRDIDKEKQRDLMYGRLFAVAKTEMYNDTEKANNESILSVLLMEIKKEGLEVKPLTDKILNVQKECSGRMTDEAKADIIKIAKEHGVSLK